MKQFSIEAKVYYADTDAGGVVYHSKYLDFAERARTDFLASKNLIQTKLLEKYNILFVVRNINIEYLLPAKLDDVLVITVNIKELKGVILTMEQNIYRKSDNALLVKLDVKLVTINKNFKLAKFPKEVIDTIISE